MTDKTENVDLEIDKDKDKDENTVNIIDNISNGNIEDAKRGIKDIIQTTIKNFVMKGQELEDKPDLTVEKDKPVEKETSPQE